MILCTKTKNPDSFVSSVLLDKEKIIFFFYPFKRISEMENLGQLDGLREQNNGDLVSSQM